MKKAADGDASTVVELGALFDSTLPAVSIFLGGLSGGKNSSPGTSFM